MRFLFLVIFCVCWWCSLPVEAARYGVARTPAPMLNTAGFRSIFGGTDGKTLKTDRCGQVRELEFIALPGTVFSIHGEVNDGAASALLVETDDYPMPPGKKLYVDSRVIEPSDARPLPRVRRLPPAIEIIARLHGAIGSPYVWGGNLQGGVAELLDLFYGAGVPAAARGRLTLAGLDCSGLLYQATDGWTPRNTSQLVAYGRGLPIAGKRSDEIAGLLEPLDLIVWNGHVLIVLDRQTIIESRLECGKPGNGGVVTTPLRRRVAEIMRTRRPLDSWPVAGKQRDIFVVRRWVP